jgi:hypothetical protein
MVKNKILKKSKKSQFGLKPSLATPLMHVVLLLNAFFYFFIIIIKKYNIHTTVYTNNHEIR